MSKSGPRDETEGVQILLRTRLPVSRGLREAQQCYTVTPYTAKKSPSTRCRLTVQVTMSDLHANGPQLG